TITTAGEEILENFTAALTGLSVGYHKLYGRVKDTHGKWSLTFQRNIEVIKDETAKVVNGEYFFKTDNGLGDCVSVVFTTPSADGSFTFNILPAQMPADADTLFVRVRDDVYNNWSLTRWTAVNNVLPLVMLHFEAALQSNTVQLKWQTANEINTSYFNVQRSADSRNFTTVGIVKANNVSGINHYSYEDNSAGIFSQKLYYRLQAIDIDASSKYSEIKVITIGNAKSGIRLYPNPVYN